MIDHQLKQQYPSDVIRELETTLQEIGTIQPVWDEDCQEYSYSHALYPSIAAPGDTPAECIQTYHRLLARFLAERMQGNLAPHVQRMTSGRGGARPGSGRPAKEPTKMVRLPVDVVIWIKKRPRPCGANSQADGLEKNKARFIAIPLF